ncbi:MAG: PIG-L family deacetylase [Ignavibacteria bacterium]|nr:PIG-L family deacetylase [Ignavibacteria bacterium]
MKKVILAVSAHPDDIEFSCGGTMFKYEELGFEIYFAVATNGENGFKIAHKPKAERIKIRHKEQLKAAGVLGVKKVFFLNQRDCHLEYTEGLRTKLVKIIKEVEPDIIFSFDPANKSFESINLNHRDHRIIAEAVFDAVFAARNRYAYPGNPHAVSFFHFFGPDKPNYFENITKYIDCKIKLIEAHRSQFDDYNSMAKWVKFHLSSYTRKYKFSEKFRIVEIKKPFVMEDAGDKSK